MVFYFTATGNSLYVAKCIDEYPVSIPQAIKNSSIYSDNQIGIVCPIYCGEIPNTVKEFLKESKFDTKYMYLILTYGNSASDCPEFTYNEFKALGINFDYIDTVYCVDKYLPVFDMAEENCTYNQEYQTNEKRCSNCNRRRQETPQASGNAE